MADTKKVIRMLTWLAEINQGAKEALELLKEQPDVVRCGDCKYYSDGFCYNPNTFDSEKTCGNTVPDWFCADGKRESER